MTTINLSVDAELYIAEQLTGGAFQSQEQVIENAIHVARLVQEFRKAAPVDREMAQSILDTLVSDISTNGNELGAEIGLSPPCDLPAPGRPKSITPKKSPLPLPDPLVVMVEDGHSHV